MKLFAGVIVLIISCLYIVQCAQYKNCGSELGEFVKIDVTDCDEKQPRCILKRGGNATIIIDFKLNENVTESISEVKAVCHGKVGGLDVPFKLPNDNACVDSGIECPITKDIVYSYDASFPVLKVYPRVNVDVKYELKDAEGKDIVCVIIPVKIQ